MFFGLNDALDGAESSARELFRYGWQIGREIREGRGIQGRNYTKAIEKLFRIGEIDFYTRHAGIVHDQRMQIVQIFGEEKRSKSVICEKRVARPVADERCQRVQVIVQTALQRRDQQVCILDDAPDLDGGLIDTREVGAEAEVTSQRFHRGADRFPIFLTFLKVRPFGKGFGAFFDPDSVAEVVAENHVETRKQSAEKKIGNPTEPRSWRRGQHHAVADIAVNNELVCRIAFV